MKSMDLDPKRIELWHNLRRYNFKYSSNSVENVNFLASFPFKFHMQLTKVARAL